MKLSELGKRQVINVRDGKCMGYICDIAIDISCGEVIEIIVPGPCKCFGLIAGEFEYRIPWVLIRKIGPDVILVDVCIEDVICKII